MQKKHKPQAPKRSHEDNDRSVMGIHAIKATLEYMPTRALKLFLADKSPRLQELADLAKSSGAIVEFLAKPTFIERFGDDVVHQGAILSTHPFPYVDLHQALSQKLDLVLVLDSIEDPRNLGRAARSAFAMGAQLLVIPKDRAAQITATVEKAAVGTLAQLPVAVVTNLNQALLDIKKAGLWVVGAAEEAKNPAWRFDFTQPSALVIGNEEKGLRKLISESCDELVCIPMAKAGLSLNAADAASLLLYESSRQRSQAFATQGT